MDEPIDLAIGDQNEIRHIAMTYKLYTSNHKLYPDHTNSDDAIAAAIQIAQAEHVSVEIDELSEDHSLPYARITADGSCEWRARSTTP